MRLDTPHKTLSTVTTLTPGTRDAQIQGGTNGPSFSQGPSLNSLSGHARQALGNVANQLSHSGDNANNTYSNNSNVAQQTGAINTIKAQFAQRFGDLASRPAEFNQLMQQVFGPNMDQGTAEAFRQKALQGNVDWLPKIEVLSEQNMRGGLGAYDAQRDVIYLNEKVLADPSKAVAVYAEEVGHALDQRLNKTDTKGDEGEMFRRLLGGEKLSAADIKSIRSENDKGTVNVNGREVQVEFFLKKIAKAVKKAVKGVGNAIKKVGEGIGDVAKGIGDAVSGAWKGVWKGVKKIMESELFQKILMVAQFIPALAPFAKIAQIVSAAYQAYKGIKTGNIGQAAMGVIGAATGASKAAGALGLSTKTAAVLGNVSKYGQYGLAAYQAHKTGNLEGIAMAAIGSIPKGSNLIQLKNAAQLYEKAQAIKTGLDRGDELGALLAGATLVGNYVKEGSKLDRALDTIRDIGGNVRALEQAIKQKDWLQATNLIMNDVANYSKLSPTQLEKMGNALRVAGTAANIDQLVKNRDWLGAGLGIADIGYNLSTNKDMQQQLLKAGDNMKQVDGVFQALRAKDYGEALTQLNDIFGKPLPANELLGSVKDIQTNAKAIEQAVRQKDFNQAASLILNSIQQHGNIDETNAFAKVRQSVEMAGALQDALSQVKQGNVQGAYNQLSQAGLLGQMNVGEKISVFQGIYDAVRNERYGDAAVSLNSLLGKSWEVPQWMHQLERSADQLSSVTQAIENRDWQGAANGVMNELAKYIPIDPDVRQDVNRLAQVAVAMSNTAQVVTQNVGGGLPNISIQDMIPGGGINPTAQESGLLWMNSTNAIQSNNQQIKNQDSSNMPKPTTLGHPNTNPATNGDNKWLDSLTSSRRGYAEQQLSLLNLAIREKTIELAFIQAGLAAETLEATLGYLQNPLGGAKQALHGILENFVASETVKGPAMNDIKEKAGYDPQQLGERIKQLVEERSVLVDKKSQYKMSTEIAAMSIEKYQQERREYSALTRLSENLSQLDNSLHRAMVAQSESLDIYNNRAGSVNSGLENKWDDISYDVRFNQQKLEKIHDIANELINDSFSGEATNLQIEQVNTQLETLRKQADIFDQKINNYQHQIDGFYQQHEGDKPRDEIIYRP